MSWLKSLRSPALLVVGALASHVAYALAEPAMQQTSAAEMQEHFRDMGAALCPRLNELTRIARKGIPVFISQHGHHLTKDEAQRNALVRRWGYQGSIR